MIVPLGGLFLLARMPSVENWGHIFICHLI
jgi:hypothetical protein